MATTAAHVIQRNTPPEGHLHLVLYKNEALEEFYLEIPIIYITQNCLKPRKYLKYIGWCVLGRHGELMDDNQQLVGLDGGVMSQDVYEYSTGVSARETLKNAIDLEVIKQRTATSTRSSDKRIQFTAVFEKRDTYCIFSGFPEPIGCHLIPFPRGSEWLKIILENRPRENNEDKAIFDINDVRNGFLASSLFHNNAFERRYAVILKTPNPILRMEDIPPRTPRPLWPDSCYTTDSRYTFQWLVTRHQGIHSAMPNGVDAAFARDGEGQKPSPTLLHYNYGCAAAKHWGRNSHFMDNRVVKRPTVKVSSMDPPFANKAKDHYHNLRSKWDSAPTVKAAAGPSGTKAKDSEELGESESWDEEDIVMFFSLNAPHTRQRFAEEDQTRRELIARWRAEIPGNDPVY